MKTMRLIDADCLKEKGRYDDYDEFVVDYDDIKNAPTIDPVKHGRWITSNCVISYGTKSQPKVYTECKCSVCGGRFGRMSDLFCYHCGAKMDEEE